MRSAGPAAAPELAREVVEIVCDVLGEAVVGAYLHGSAATTGLRPTSDVDVLVVVGRATTEDERGALVDRLLEISGRRARPGPARPVELTIVVESEVRPWRYPPRAEFQYGEWLRDEYEAGLTPEPGPNPDLAPVIAMALAADRALHGPPIAAVLDPVPTADLRRAIVAGVPDLLADLEPDTRNVLLTLARVWFTLATGELQSKDVAATWAIERLPADHGAVLARARQLYLDGIDDGANTWTDLASGVRSVADRVIERSNAWQDPRRLPGHGRPRCTTPGSGRRPEAQSRRAAVDQPRRSRRHAGHEVGLGPDPPAARHHASMYTHEDQLDDVGPRGTRNQRRVLALIG